MQQTKNNKRSNNATKGNKRLEFRFQGRGERNNNAVKIFRGPKLFIEVEGQRLPRCLSSLVGYSIDIIISLFSLLFFLQIYLFL